jgi:hypothetical protein
MFLLKSSSASSIDASPSTYQRCNEAFPETQRQISCETMMTDTKGRYLVVPCSYAATIAAANGNYGASANPASASFPFILCVYSAHPVLIKRRPAWIPALTIAKQLATIRGDSKPLGDVSLPRRR